MRLTPRNKSVKYISRKGLKAKRYFHYVDSFCQSYIKAKQHAHEQSKRRRKHCHSNEENYPIFHELIKPKSGFYALKGCKLAPQSPHKVQAQPKGKVLNQFLRKFLDRKQRLKSLQNQQTNPTRIVASYQNQRKGNDQNSLKPVSNNHAKSVIFSMQRKRKYHGFMLTEPSCDTISQNNKTIQQCRSNSPLNPIPLNLLKRDNRQISKRNKCTI